MIDLILHELPTPLVGVAIVLAAVVAAIVGFEIAKRFLLVRLKYDSDTNDALSGALGAVGVLYGVTVGLVAIDGWQRRSEAEHIVAQEAVAIQELHLIVRPEESIGHHVDPTQSDGTPAFHEPTRDDIHKTARQLLDEYLSEIICVVWDDQNKVEDWGDQKKDKPAAPDWELLRDLRMRLFTIEPRQERQKVRYAAALEALRNLSELRQLRRNAADDHLSGVMWTCVLVGAAVTIFLGYFLKFRDVWLHRLVVGLVSSFLGFVLLLILVNDKPFLGRTGIERDQYIAKSWIIEKPKTWSDEDSWAKRLKKDRKQACQNLGDWLREGIEPPHIP